MTAEAVLWMLAEWIVRAAALAGAAGLLLWVLRIKDVSLRLAIWTGVLLGALAMPLLSFVAPPLSIAMHRASPRPAVVPNLPEIQDGLPLGAVPDRASFSWRESLVALWAAVAAAMLLRLGVGFLAGRRILAASRAVKPGVRESDDVCVPVTMGMLHPVVLLPVGWRQWEPEKLTMVLAHELAHARRRDPLRRMAASLYRALCWFHPLAWWLWRHLAELAEAASDDAALSAVPNHALYAETLLGFFRLMPRRVKWEGVAMSSLNKATSRIERILDVRRRLSGVLSARVFAGIALAALPLVYLTAAASPVWADAAPVSPPSQEASTAPQTAALPQPAGAASPNSAPVQQARLPLPPATHKPFVPGTPVPEALPAAAVAADLPCGGVDVYNQWLNQDVLYIISPEERTAFAGLKSARACDEFIERFWDRRNPASGSGHNLFKEEHYRRIAYANVHFGSDGKPGWQTGRGRIYIIYGPPDETQHLPDSGRGSPKEAWVYRNVMIGGASSKLTVEFIDEAAANGEPATHVVIDLENPK